MTEDTNKRRAATAALSYIKDGMSLGVGTGSTVDILSELLQPLASKLGAVVSSSERSTRRLAEFGVRTVDLASTGDLDRVPRPLLEEFRFRSVHESDGNRRAATFRLRFDERSPVFRFIDRVSGPPLGTSLIAAAHRALADA